MPELIEHIDAIARQKQRGVLFVTFDPNDAPDAVSAERHPYDYRTDALRLALLAWHWLDTDGYAW